MRCNIAPHDIIYYHLIASARKILFSLFQAGTCRPPSAIFGRCLPSIGLRFTHARRNAAPRTVPHVPRPDGAGPTAAPITRTPARHAHGHPAAHPIAAAGACRGCSPAAVTLCENRAALARAFIYNLFAMANRCGE